VNDDARRLWAVLLQGCKGERHGGEMHRKVKQCVGSGLEI
jgi:hypothetical protein